MKDFQPIVDTLQAALLQRMGDEVDLIFQYGSHFKGTAHQYSDVDISWVPVNATTWDAITVMVDDTLCDLYPIHWSRLEQMAEYRDVSATVLLSSHIVYQRTEAAAERFHGLSAQLRALLEPAARPEMVRQALEIFQGARYDFYLLREQAARGHQIGCLQQAHAVLRTVLHCLAVCNQQCIDTRKLAQVLALPKLPVGFAATVEHVVAAMEPQDVLAAVETLLRTTRDLLLAVQREWLGAAATYPNVFDAAYPELKRDMQAILQACERQDQFALKGAVFSLQHEMSRRVAQVATDFVSTGFNGLMDYEQDLTVLGFPALAPLLVAGDFAELHRQCQVFDQRLKEFLAERAVKLNNFATLAELRQFLADDLPE